MSYQRLIAIYYLILSPQVGLLGYLEKGRSQRDTYDLDSPGGVEIR